MSIIAERIRMESAALDQVERAVPALFLIQSLDHGRDEDADSAWEAELERCAEEIKSGDTQGEPAAKVFAELRKKYS